MLYQQQLPSGGNVIQQDTFSLPLMMMKMILLMMHPVEMVTTWEDMLQLRPAPTFQFRGQQLSPSSGSTRTV